MIIQYKKKMLGRLRHEWKNGNQTETEVESLHLTYLHSERLHWWPFVNIPIKLGIPNRSSKGDSSSFLAYRLTDF